MINMVLSCLLYIVSHCWLLTHITYSSTISGPTLAEFAADMKKSNPVLPSGATVQETNHCPPTQKTTVNSQ